MSEKKKTALMICYCFPPDMRVGSLRSRKYAQYLDGYGWHCRVLTGSFGRDRRMVFSKTVEIMTIYCPDLSRLLNASVKLACSLKLGIIGIKRLLSKARSSGDWALCAFIGLWHENLTIY